MTDKKQALKDELKRCQNLSNSKYGTDRDAQNAARAGRRLRELNKGEVKWKTE